MDSKIFDTLLEPTFILDQNRLILYCNDSASILCDVSVRKIQRTKPALDKIFQFADSVSGLDTLADINDPTPYQEVKFTTESGKAGKVQITLQRYPTLDGQKLWLVYFRDVTLEETLQKKYRAELEQKETVILDLQKAQAELKNYSENLEKMVEVRTVEIARMNQTMRALLDSLSQGFFIFDQEGTCLPVYSKACATTIQCEPAGKKIWDVLKIPNTKVDDFQKWMTTLFMEMLPFPDIVAIGPQTFPHSEGQHIQLEYYPLRNQEQVLEGVVIVASDITTLIHAQTEAENEKAHASMILKLIQNKRAFASFLREANLFMNEIQTEFKKTEFDPKNSFRLLHTIKGGAASFSMKPVADKCHEAETFLSNWKEYPTLENYLKLKNCSLQIPQVYQEYLKQNSEIIGTISKTERFAELPLSQLENFSLKLKNDPHIQRAFYEEFMMEPIHHFFESFNEPVQQIANIVGKSIAPLKFKNEKLKILPEPYEGLFNSLIHAYRNAADHGIESIETRLQKGKPDVGTITTEFKVIKENQKEFLLIEIQDDGGGIDPQKIQERLAKKGIDTTGKTDEQFIQHVFDSQFSTKEQVSEISGRGVGMDAILHSAKKLGGNAWVQSKVDVGTTLFVQVPFFRRLKEAQMKKTAA